MNYDQMIAERQRELSQVQVVLNQAQVRVIALSSEIALLRQMKENTADALPDTGADNSGGNPDTGDKPRQRRR